jgi:hypothetical protein
MGRLQATARLKRAGTTVNDWVPAFLVGIEELLSPKFESSVRLVAVAHGPQSGEDLVKLGVALEQIEPLGI